MGSQWCDTACQSRVDTDRGCRFYLYALKNSSYWWVLVCVRDPEPLVNIYLHLHLCIRHTLLPKVKNENWLPQVSTLDPGMPPVLCIIFFTQTHPLKLKAQLLISRLVKSGVFKPEKQRYSDIILSLLTNFQHCQEWQTGLVAWHYHRIMMWHLGCHRSSQQKSSMDINIFWLLWQILWCALSHIPSVAMIDDFFFPAEKKNMQDRTKNPVLQWWRN